MFGGSKKTPTIHCMTCEHCCGADRLFDMKSARKELKKYKRKGPGKPTRALINMLFPKQTKGKSLLDVGGGIGALQWSFLKRGGAQAVDVDASLGYLSIAMSHAKDLNFSDRTGFIHGDLVDQIENIPETDFVTLDKVICCYPDYQILLQKALKKCNGSVGLVFPVGGWFWKGFTQLSKIYFYLKRNPFRTYIHAPREVQQFIVDHGFALAGKKKVFPWHVQVYERL